MKKLLTFFFLAPLLFFEAFNVQAQAPFANEIKAFKTQDSISFPPGNAILFVGSSSFRKWTDVQSYFPDHKIINRGFGGSILPDVIRYEKEIIAPYHPKQVVIYCGDNDLASSDTVTPDIVVKRFKQLFHLIRTDVPKANIAFVSIKPSPRRIQLFSKMQQANAQIKKFLKKQKNTSFINVFDPMLVNNQPRQDIFLSDSLHMNEKGYAIWRKVIQPYLLK
ncbi:MAG: GDSL-type esterase/lipase family protein [Flavisolibacter sp.]